MTSERAFLKELLKKNLALETDVSLVSNKQTMPNPVSEARLGLYRPATARMAGIADIEILKAFRAASLPEPTFLEAGPRKVLRHNPRRVQAAVVTTGGLAPGLHCVIHSIVNRHYSTYSIDKHHGHVFGVYDSYRGLCSLPESLADLDPATTEEWLDQGGSKLGAVRFFPYGRGDEGLTRMAQDISRNLTYNGIDILYVIGGDGSLKTAHKISQLCPGVSVIGIPKTMDNDVLWVWQSFGFDTAVEQATHVINILHSEAESTRRVCVIELFGAESGFVAANATLASGHVDFVMIPEVFKALAEDQAQEYLDVAIDYIGKIIQTSRRRDPHAVIVVAEGVGTVLEEKRAKYGGVDIKRDTFVGQLASSIKDRVHDARGDSVPVFVNQPRHHIRAVPANAHDQIYCERLGALAVDNALAGYTDCMVSQWLTEYVLVPLSLVDAGTKCIPINGMFWKQVVCSTGQPLSPAEDPTASTNMSCG